MPTHLRCGILCVLFLTACDAPAEDSVYFEIPMKHENLVGGDYVAFPRLASSAQVPDEGDPVTFNADSTVANARLGLAGRWLIVDDSTVSITAQSGAVQLFRVRIPEGVMISPETTTVTHDAAFTITSRGSMVRFSIGR